MAWEPLLKPDRTFDLSSSRTPRAAPGSRAEDALHAAEHQEELEAVRPPSRSLFLQGPGGSHFAKKLRRIPQARAAGGGCGVVVVPVVLPKKSVSPERPRG